MAAIEGVSTFNFLHSSLSKGTVLVAGDGNFSFSLSLATCRSFIPSKTRLVLTSFEDEKMLAQNECARMNIDRLRLFQDLDVLYNIDATLLPLHFPKVKFDRIIFNFPHTGGKSNIKQCRQLLKDFFVSATKQLRSRDGDVCVTLCKGQGGTPVDKPQRLHGNSWQIVDNAAKAGLMLDQIHPFVTSDYLHYNSVGYRGQLTKGFRTKGGLIHIFIPGKRLGEIENLCDRSKDALLSYVYGKFEELSNTLLSSKLGHPSYNVKNEILIMANRVTQTQFEETKMYNAGQNITTGLFECTGDCPTLNRLLNAMKTNRSFALTATASIFPQEISPKSGIRMTYLFLCKLYSNHEFDVMEKQKQELVDKIKDSFLSEEKFLYEVQADDLLEKSKSEIKYWTNSSDVAHLARKKCQIKGNIDGSKGSCLCRKLCLHYLNGRTSDVEAFPFEIFDPESIKGTRNSSGLLIVYGYLKQDALKYTQNMYGWLIITNLDALAMIRNLLSDIRLLTSSDLQWEKRPTDDDCKMNDMDGMSTPVPRNLYPPEYSHDISFWISEQVSQELFFLTVVALTNNCVRDVKLTEMYHDEDEHRVSCNYHMIYTRADGPLSHLEAVELQNRLRRALIVFGFGLK